MTSRPRAVVVIGPATGAPARAYRRLLAALEARGCAVRVVEYGGIGLKRPSSWRGFEASLRTWAADLGAVLQAAHDQAREHGVPLGAVLHSISGFLLGLCPQAGALDRLVTVGAQLANPFDLAPRELLRTLVLRHAFMPLATLALGHFPARRLGLGEDLPRDVALDWARRVLDGDARRALHGVPTTFDQVRAPILALAADDDPFATPAALERLHRRFVGTRVTTRRLRPAELGVPAIGHLGLLIGPLVDRVAPLLGDQLLA